MDRKIEPKDFEIPDPLGYDSICILTRNHFQTECPHGHVALSRVAFASGSGGGIAKAVKDVCLAWGVC